MPEEGIKVNRKVDEMLRKLLSSGSYSKIGILANPSEGGASKASDSKIARIKRENMVSDVETDVSLVTVAAKHEFGDGNIPERSFLRSTLKEEKKNIVKTYRKAAKRQIMRGRYDVKSVLDLVGVMMVGKVKKKFTNNDWRPLKDPTRGGINKDGNATPLVDTNQLRGSIAHETVVGRSA